MYLAKIRQGQEMRYLLRKSIFDRDLGRYLFRQVYDLGPRPGDFIHHGEYRLPFFDEGLEEAVARAVGNSNVAGLLEELLWEFLTSEEREQLARTRRRQPVKLMPFTPEDEERLRREIHLFDRRRLYYLRYGAVDQSRIHRLHKKLCRPLFGQCRDEREYYIAEQEKVLHPAEYRTYVFAIFDLQRFFGESFARYMPEALDQELMADRLVEEICRLNGDDGFWEEVEGQGSLRPHLQRYLVMFFDYGYPPRSFTYDFTRDFINRHRQFRWPEWKPDDATEVNAIFGRTLEELRSMSKRELARLFRKRAKETHPDAGGDHERFVRLNEVYERVKKRLG
ncbi:MAG: J domain-containing protein [Desulfoprunum sp.]|jgi:hypothetical protein|uniref:J domain-containing protein n=1 Tax=Desulfoprunum sp. TaxID=2020866 RepID=UPI00052BECDE|nr:hypothetical protein JT06_12875 [Desulfobulbus sp. Tol-SR]